jgi:hypothetical protein
MRGEGVVTIQVLKKNKPVMYRSEMMTLYFSFSEL